MMIEQQFYALIASGFLKKPQTGQLRKSQIKEGITNEA